MTRGRDRKQAKKHGDDSTVVGRGVKKNNRGATVGII